jgi:hypothetical protein
MKGNVVPLETLFFQNLSSFTGVAKAANMPRRLFHAIGIVSTVDVNTPGIQCMGEEVVAAFATRHIRAGEKTALMLV